ncbi:MAG TPA: hypothetical protein VGK29_15170 [Paludibaculum sp.]
MDTRNKIVSAGEAESRLSHMAFLVSGWFDPMLAVHAARIDEIPDQFSVAVQILDPPDPLLPARARAELVAALRRVDLVILDEEQTLTPALRLEVEEAELRARFLAHVRERQL